MVPTDTLRESCLFAEVGERELERLARLAAEVHFERGTVIFSEDDAAEALYLLREGWVDVVNRSGPQGQHQQLVTTLAPGDIFGWSAVVEPYRYTASVVCASPVTAIRLAGSELLALFDDDPRLGCLVFRQICRVISERLRATRLQMMSLAGIH